MGDEKKPLLEANEETKSSNVSNLFRVILGVFFLFAISFEVAGYQALRPILIDSGVYSWLCKDGLESNEPCIQQQLRLDLMLILTVSFSNMLTLPVGFFIRATGIHINNFLTRLGNLPSCIIGSALSLGGCLLFAFSSSKFDAYIYGFILLGSSCSFLGFSLFSLAGLFPKHTGLLFSIIVAALDGSAAIFYFFQLIYLHVSGVTIRWLFLAYAAFPVLLLLSSKFILYTPPPAPPSSDTKKEESVAAPPREDCIFPSNSIRDKLFSGPYLLFLCWGSLYMLTKYYYLTNAYSEILWITGNSEHARMGAQVFSIMFPCGAVFAPITSWLLDKRGISVSLAVMGLVSIIAGITSNIPNYPLQYFTITLVVFNRFFFFAAAPVLMQKLYGQRDFMALYGTSSFVGGVFNNLSYLLTYISKDLLHNNFLIVNAVTNGLCGIFAIILAISVQVWAKKAKEKTSLSLQGSSIQN